MTEILIKDIGTTFNHKSTSRIRLIYFFYLLSNVRLNFAELIPNKRYVCSISKNKLSPFPDQPSHGPENVIVFDRIPQKYIKQHYDYSCQKILNLLRP